MTTAMNYTPLRLHVLSTVLGAPDTHNGWTADDFRRSLPISTDDTTKSIQELLLYLMGDNLLEPVVGRDPEGPLAVRLRTDRTARNEVAALVHRWRAEHVGSACVVDRGVSGGR